MIQINSPKIKAIRRRLSMNNYQYLGRLMLNLIRRIITTRIP